MQEKDEFDDSGIGLFSLHFSIPVGWPIRRKHEGHPNGWGSRARTRVLTAYIIGDHLMYA